MIAHPMAEAGASIVAIRLSPIISRIFEAF
jgi:hypothetical protein